MWHFLARGNLHCSANNNTTVCLLLVVGEDVLYALDLAIVCSSRGDIAIGAGANTDVGRDSRSTFSVDGGVAVMDSLRYLRPWAL